MSIGFGKVYGNGGSSAETFGEEDISQTPENDLLPFTMEQISVSEKQNMGRDTPPSFFLAFSMRMWYNSVCYI